MILPSTLVDPLVMGQPTVYASVILAEVKVVTASLILSLRRMDLREPQRGALRHERAHAPRNHPRFGGAFCQ